MNREERVTKPYLQDVAYQSSFPDDILSGLTEKLRSRRPLTIGGCAQKKTASFVKPSRPDPRLSMLLVANIRASAIAASSVTNAASKSPARPCDGNGWDTSPWPRRWPTSGTPAASPATEHFAGHQQAHLDRVLYFAQYIVTSVDEEARQRALSALTRKSGHA
jgi:hypothetical protein